MPGVGTLIDMSGIIAGGATALAFGRLFSEQMKNMMMTVCGISVFVIGITGIMQGMLTVSGGAVLVNGSIPLLISLVAGAAIGEAQTWEALCKSNSAAERAETSRTAS